MWHRVARSRRTQARGGSREHYQQSARTRTESEGSRGSRCALWCKYCLHALEFIGMARVLEHARDDCNWLAGRRDRRRGHLHSRGGAWPVGEGRNWRERILRCEFLLSGWCAGRATQWERDASLEVRAATAARAGVVDATSTGGGLRVRQRYMHVKPWRTRSHEVATRPYNMLGLFSSTPVAAALLKDTST